MTADTTTPDTTKLAASGHSDDGEDGAQAGSGDWMLPSQRAVLDAIRVPPDRRPTYSDALGDALAEELEQALAPTLARLARVGEPLWVSKRMLAGVHGCEARYVAESETPFSWSVPTARGTILHKAVELFVHDSQVQPTVCVDRAIRRLSDSDTSIGAYLSDQADAAEVAELRSECVSLLTRFAETFPPIPAAWRPATEQRVRKPLADGRLMLSGRYDLALGTPSRTHQPDGRLQAGKAIIDIKTAGRSPADREDLRFYALLETLTVKAPPLVVGSFYVAEARIEPELVTTELLHQAVARTVEGVEREVSLRVDGREPSRLPGPPCRWCVLRNDCVPGRSWLEERDE